jgi:hypothetical protein
MGLSGATMKALQRYGQNLASAEYQNAYNRFAQNRQYGQNVFQANRAFDYGASSDLYGRRATEAGQRYNRLSNIAGMGQQAAGNLSNLAIGAGQNQAQLAGSMGNVQAAGIMGPANQWASLAGNVGRGLSVASMLADYSGMGGSSNRVSGLGATREPGGGNFDSSLDDFDYTDIG